MKTCTQCKETKPLDLFYKTKSSSDGRQYACKSCMAIAYNKSRSKKLDHYREVSSNRRKKNKTLIDEWKENKKCMSCGEADPVCLDLHHLDPSIKEDHPSNIKWSLKSFLEEAQKCVVLCSNCHRKVHAGKLILSVA